MSLVSAALNLGYTVRRDVAGETVTLNGTEYTVPLINRLPKATEPGGPVNVSMNEGSIIEFPKGVDVKIGDTLTDEESGVHNVQEIRVTESAQLLTCELTRDEP
jgi:hypothetical protein